MALTVGAVDIKVKPDTDGFRQRVEREIRKLRDVKLKVKLDDKDLKREIAKVNERSKQAVEFDSELDTKGLKAKAVLAAAGAKSTVHFDAKLNSSKLMRQAFLTSKGIKNLLSQDAWEFKGETLSLKHLIDVSGVGEALPGINMHLKEMRRTLSALKGLGDVLTPSTRSLGAFAAVGKAAKGMTSSLFRSIKIIPSFKNALQGFISHANVAAVAMGGLAAGALGVKAVAVGLGTVFGYVVDGVKQLSGVFVTVPGILGGIAMWGATVFTGFRGMGKALAAAIDPSQDLESAIADLAPQAQEFARSVRRITPEWQDVRRQVQGTMFDGLGAQLERVSRKQLPAVREGMDKVAGSTNRLFKAFGDFAGMETTTKALNKGFEHTSGIVDSLARSISPVMVGLQNIGVVGLKSVEKMSKSWPGLAEKFSSWTSNEENQKKMEQWIENGVLGFKKLGSTVGNFYRSFQEIGNAFGVDFGSDAIAKFETFSQKFRDWLGDADDADSRISKFAAKTEQLAQPWQEFGSNAWEKLFPAAKELTPFLEEVSTTTAETLSGMVDKVAPKLEGFFKFLSDHKGVIAPMVTGLLALRAALGVFKLGRMFLAPFLSAATGTAGVIGKMAKGTSKIAKRFSATGRVEAMDKKAAKKAAKVAQREEKQKARARIDGMKEARRYDKVLAKAEKQTARDVAQARKAGDRAAGKSFGARARAEEKHWRNNLSMVEAQTRRTNKAEAKRMKSIGKSAKGASRLGRAAGGVGKLGKGLTKAGRGAGKMARGLGSAARFGVRFGSKLIPGVGTALLLADAGMMIYENWDSIKGAGEKAVGWFKTKFPGAADAIGNTWNKVKDGATKTFDKVKEKWRGLFKDQSGPDGKPNIRAAGVGDMANQEASWQGFKDRMSKLWDGVQVAWSGVWQGIKDTVAGKWEDIKTAASEGWDSAKQKISDAWTGVKEFWLDKWNGAKEAVANKWNEIKTSAAEGWENAKTTVSNAWNGVQEFWSEKWTSIKDTVLQKMEEVKTAAAEKWANAKETVSEAWSGVSEKWGTAWDGVKSWVGEKWQGIKDTAATTWQDASTTVSTAWDGVSTGWGTVWTGVQGLLGGTWGAIKSDAASKFSDASNSVKSAWDDANGSTNSTWPAIQALVAAMVTGMQSSIASGFTAMVSTIVGAMAQKVAAISQGVAQAAGVIATLPGRAVAALGNVGGLLVASGQALVQGFISGINSMVGAVAGAASRVVSAARAFFPFSPAKKGPFSGRGYTTWSGKALVKDFAEGMLSQKQTAAKAAADVTKAAQKNFSGLTVDSVHAFNREQMLKPVREHNAEQFAKYREKNEEAEKKHAERIAEIAKQTAEQQGKASDSVAKLKGKNVNKAEKLAERNASIAEGEAKKIAKADEQLVEAKRKNREELEKNLKDVQWDEQDLSFKSYWIEGTKSLLKEKLQATVRESRLASHMRDSVKQAVSVGRKYLGNHPFLARVEANVDNEAFSFAVEQAIVESGIHEVPINFVVANVEGLKQDLGMGDGVVSRAIDVALEYNSNNTDAKAYRERQTKTEVHFHVEDIGEAMRLEDLRYRKQMMKFQ